MTDVDAEPLRPQTSAALIGVLAVLAGTITLGEVPADLVGRLQRRLERDGFPADRPVEVHLEELVERVRYGAGERA